MSKIKPKCVKGSILAALTAEGFFLPCCWADRRNEFFQDRGFLDSSLNIENVDDIVSEIFNSKTWVDFFHDVQYNQELMPSICKQYCGVNEQVNEYTTIQRLNIE